MMTTPKSTKPVMPETPPTPPPKGSEVQPQATDGADANPMQIQEKKSVKGIF